jgi:hypothetical protein
MLSGNQNAIPFLIGFLLLLWACGTRKRFGKFLDKNVPQYSGHEWTNLFALAHQFAIICDK